MRSTTATSFLFQSCHGSGAELPRTAKTGNPVHSCTTFYHCWMFINFVVIWVCSLSCFVIVCHLGVFFLSLFDHFGTPQKPGFKKNLKWQKMYKNNWRTSAIFPIFRLCRICRVPRKREMTEKWQQNPPTPLWRWRRAYLLGGKTATLNAQWHLLI